MVRRPPAFYDMQDEYQRHAKAGDLTEGLEIAHRMWDAFPERRNYTWALLATAHAAMGDIGLVAQVLQQALDANALWRLSLLEVPELDVIRSDSRCQAVIEEARRRIEAKHYRSLVIVERNPGDVIAPLLLHLHGANSNAASDLPRWRGAAGLCWIVAGGQSCMESVTFS